MSKAFNQIMAGLNDAQAYLDGDEQRGVTHQRSATGGTGEHIDLASLYFPERGRADPFRPKRYPARGFFKGLNLEAQLDDQSVQLNDLSYTGAGFRAGVKFQTGKTVTVRLSADGHELLTERAVVEWVERDRIGYALGVRFLTIADLPSLRKGAEDLSRHLTLYSDLDAIFEAVPSEYVTLSAKLLHHLACLKEKCAIFEEDGASREHRRDVAARLLKECGPTFQEIWFEFNDIIAAIPKKDPQYIALKQYTERVLTPHFMNAPVWRRSYEKPMGYPGDFEIMLYAYHSGQPTQAHTLYDEVLHLYLAHTLGACIRGRMHLTLDVIRDHLNRTRELNRPIEMLNLGCGAAVELPILFGEKDLMRGRSVNVTLVEQGADPIQYAIERALPAARASTGEVTVRPLQVSYADMMRFGRHADHIGQQHVIYSLGLVDYFRTATAKSLARDMWDKLAPGGVLVWCNVAACREGCEWPLECLTDWRLHYRDEREMRDIFDLPGADVRLDMEPSGQIWVASVQKPQ